MPDGGDFFLAESRIAIIGLGLMGGSLALALKGKCGAIFGIDNDQHTLEMARQQQIVDLVTANLSGCYPMRMSSSWLFQSRRY